MTFFTLARSAAIAGFAFVGAAASAATVTADFTATVSSSSGDAALGDAVTGTLVFDDAALPTALTTTRNAFDATSLSASLNGTTFSGVGGALRLDNDRTCIAGAETCAFSDQINAGFNRVLGGSLSINITATTTDPVSSARPAILSGNALSDLIASLTSGAVLTEANGQATIQITGDDLGPNCFVSCQVFATFGTFTIRQPAPDPDPGIGVVPLPAGLPLMLAGLGGLALLRRRK